MRSALFIVVFFTLFLGKSVGQVLEPVKWETSFRQIDDKTFELVFIAKIEDGWTIYSQYLKGDDGPIPTTFYFDQNPNLELKGKNEECSKNLKEQYDKVFDMKVAKFTKEAVFTQVAKVSDPKQPVVGYLEFMACDASKCLPPTEVDFQFNLSSPPPITIQSEACSQDFSSTLKVSSFAEGKLQLEESQISLTPQNSRGIIEPVKWAFETVKVSDNEYDLVFKANPDEGWVFYSQFTDPDGPGPTLFFIDQNDQFELVGKVKEEGKKKEGKDPLFEGALIVKFVEGPVFFTQRIRTDHPEEPITGFLEYTACDIRGCLPPTEVNFTFNLSGEAAAAAPIANIDGQVIDQTIPAIRESYQNPIGSCGIEDVARDQSIVWTFVLGFLGGLLALLTPCVFPMIPLTVSFFTKSSRDKKTGIRNAIWYGSSIILIYVTIGLLITALFGATALNELSTNWIANTIFFLVFVLFAFSFFGFYEITLPSSWANRSDSLAEKGGMLGIFFMAFTLAIVSFSCTGPIIGSAIVQFSSDALGPFTVMLGFSSALALPFGLFAAFPGWLNSLPRSGSWMNSVKVVLGFLELALALKFLSVADMTMHWNILPYEVFMGLWVLIFGAMTFYLFGLIKFPHEGKVKKLTPARWMFSFASLGLTIYLLTGFIYNESTKSYNSLGLLSGLAPPARYNLAFSDGSEELNPDIKAKYPSYSKCANNLDCFKDYYEGVAYAKEVDKPLLIDFTGHGCVNCRKTEEHIWVVDKIRKKLEDEFVLVSLYVDDRKPLKDTLYSEHTGKRLRDIGKKWTDFQIVNFEQNTQPLYVMMSPKERVLAAPRGYKENIDDYNQFLECGLSTFKSLTENRPIDRFSQDSK